MSKRKPEDLYPYIHARSGVKNQFRFTAFLYLILIVVIPIVYIRWLFQPYEQDERYAIRTLTPVTSSGRGDNELTLPSMGERTPTGGAAPAEATATPGGLDLPYTATPYPTYTAYPTFTPVLSPTPVYELREFLYSYYDPALGGVNCREWDEVNQVCLSTMASGLDWSQWYGRAVACSSEYPLWTIFRVVDPLTLAGDWDCLDRGGMKDGTIYLDFLDTYLRLPWNTTIKAYVIYP
jgi:hypothetical protein